MRIAITGLGAVSGFGWGLEALWSGLVAGDTAIRGPGPFPGRGPVAALEGGPHLTSDLARYAVREALGDVDPTRLGLCGASTSGDMVRGEAEYEACLDGAEPGDGFLWAQLCDRPTQILGDELGQSGPRLTVSTACTSGAAAVGTAARWIEAGHVDAAIAFGADALCQLTVHGFGSLGSISPEPCTPFDVNRTGLSLGEGAGAVLLESEERVRNGGGTPLAWLVGYGSATDAHHLTAPHPEGRGAREAILRALHGLDATEVGYVCAHGTATPKNDAMESSVFRALLPHAAVSSVKGALGHTLGGAGALELVATVLALRHGSLPPNVGLREPEPGLDLLRTTRLARPSLALTVNMAFGGHNTALAVQSCG